MIEYYEATSLTKELQAAGLQITGCNSAGEVWWIGSPTSAQLAKAEQVKAAHQLEAAKAKMRDEENWDSHAACKALMKRCDELSSRLTKLESLPTIKRLLEQEGSL